MRTLRERLRAMRDAALRGWRRMTGRQRALAAALAAGTVVAAGLGVALPLVFRGGERIECDRPLCVEVLGPEGDAVHPMTPVRVRLAGKGLDRKAAVSAIQISDRPEEDVRFEKDVLTFRPAWPGFEKGVRYEVALSLPPSDLPEGAEPLDLRFDFTVEGKLRVSSVFPKTPHGRSLSTLP